MLAIIPARGGSKGVPHKNILEVGGKPLIAWTIAQAKASGVCHRILVSTDDPEIAGIAKKEGAEVPFMRPSAIAADDTPDFPVFQHALEWLQKEEEYIPTTVVWLRPTSPLRTPEDIQKAVSLLHSSGADAVRSVCEVQEHPYWMKIVEKDGRLAPLMEGRDENSHPRRQLCPLIYLLSGLVDAVRVSSALKNKAMFTGDVRAYIAPADRSRELDTKEDLQYFVRHFEISK